jgi:hypothetical protein
MAAAAVVVSMVVAWWFCRICLMWAVRCSTNEGVRFLKQTLARRYEKPQCL